jgi:TusA-related sulfurtransferase
MKQEFRMNTSSTNSTDFDISFFLDITNEVCPLTFVRTKLLLERMTPGEVAEVRLRGTEPLENVPRSVRDHGHAVLSLEPEKEDGGADGIHRLLIRRE